MTPQSKHNALLHSITEKPVEWASSLIWRWRTIDSEEKQLVQIDTALIDKVRIHIWEYKNVYLMFIWQYENATDSHFAKRLYCLYITHYYSCNRENICHIKNDYLYTKHHIHVTLLCTTNLNNQVTFIYSLWVKQNKLSHLYFGKQFPGQVLKIV